MYRKAALGLVFYFSFLLMGHFTHGSIDAIQRLELTRSIALEGTVVTAGFGAIKYSPLQSIVMIPPYLAGYSLGKITGQNEERSRTIAYRFCAFLLNPVLCSLIAVLFFEFLGTFSLSPEIRILSSLLLVFGTLMPPYARTMFSEPLSALLILSSLICCHRALTGSFRRHLRSAFLLAGLLVLNNALYVIYGAMLLAWALWQTRASGPDRRENPASAVEALAILSAAVALYLLYNFLRFGDAFLTGYEDEGFTTPVVTGLYGLLFSIGRGLVVYSPLTVVCVAYFILNRKALDPALRNLYSLVGVAFAVFLGIYAQWHSWEGGWCWGPRFLLPFIPALHLVFPWLMQSALGKGRNRAVAGLFVAGCVYAVGINSWEYIGLWQEYQRTAFGSGAMPYADSLFNPEDASIFNNWNRDVGPKRLLQYAVALAAGFYLAMFRFKHRFFPEVP